MPRTHRSGRGARVAEAVCADRSRGTSAAWASARRWLVVAGLLSGAWFAGAACAAADEGGPVAALADDAGVQQKNEDQASGPDLVGGVEEAAPAAPGTNAGESESDDSRGHPGGADDDSDADTAPAAVSGGIDTAAVDPVGAAADADTVDSASAAATGTGGSADSASGPAGQRPEDSAVRPDEKRDPAAVQRLGDTVEAVGEVGGSAGRTVPVSVSHPQTPDTAAVVSEAAAAASGDRPDGLPDLGLDGLAPADMADAVTLPAVDLGQVDGSSDTGRASDPGAGPAARGHGDAPTAADHKLAHYVPAALADYTGPAAYDGSTGDTGDPDAAPNALGADRADAAAVGSAVNTSQFGGMCAGYLPAAASAAPAAGSLQCARQALTDVPRDLGERPIFSPD